MTRVLSESPEQTRKVAARLGAAAEPGDLACLIGPLGSGKTTFTQGFARGAGFRGSVTSPSFGLARRYPAKKATIHHLDLYRLSGKDLPNLALEEYFDDPRGVCVVEWPQVAAGALPKDRLEIRFSHRPDGRALDFRAKGPRSRRWLGRL